MMALKLARTNLRIVKDSLVYEIFLEISPTVGVNNALVTGSRKTHVSGTEVTSRTWLRWKEHGQAVTSSRKNVTGHWVFYRYQSRTQKSNFKRLKDQGGNDPRWSIPLLGLPILIRVHIFQFWILNYFLFSTHPRVSRSPYTVTIYLKKPKCIQCTSNFFYDPELTDWPNISIACQKKVGLLLMTLTLNQNLKNAYTYKS